MLLWSFNCWLEMECIKLASVQYSIGLDRLDHHHINLNETKLLCADFLDFIFFSSPLAHSTLLRRRSNDQRRSANNNRPYNREFSFEYFFTSFNVPSVTLRSSDSWELNSSWVLIPTRLVVPATHKYTKTERKSFWFVALLLHSSTSKESRIFCVVEHNKEHWSV